MRAHLSEQEKFLVLESKTSIMPDEIRKHLQECPQCQTEVNEQREMDSILIELTPQKISALVSDKIINRLLNKTFKTMFNPIWAAAGIIILLTLLFLWFPPNTSTQPTGFSYDNISVKSIEWAQKAIDAPEVFWKTINWPQVKQSASWFFQPDSTRIFFILIILGFYALIDLHIRRHFYH